MVEEPLAQVDEGVGPSFRGGADPGGFVVVGGCDSQGGFDDGGRLGVERSGELGPPAEGARQVQ
ncbi:MAG TPA: hypothetical protein VM143_17045 [Acidimicrobiales bacterium]|nr:hypothetical protein [Acidimicrobiales bacterium]